MCSAKEVGRYLITEQNFLMALRHIVISRETETMSQILIYNTVNLSTLVVMLLQTYIQMMTDFDS